MLNVLLKNHDYKYEVGELIKLFTSQFKFSNENTNRCIESEIFIENGKISSTTYYYSQNNLKYKDVQSVDIQDTDNIKKESKIVMKRSIFNVLEKVYGTNVPWGILTGIRPTKIIHELFDENKDDTYIKNLLKTKYKMQQDKVELALDVSKTERKFVYPPSDKKVAIYVSIPFCPTRCVYCSFPSNELKTWGHLKEDYVNALLKEIKGTAKIVRDLEKEVESVYIGGGTPTTLSPDEMRRVLGALYTEFDLSSVKEFTVEAGRVDSIDEEKLKALREFDIDRISINPQTMNDETLRAIGRTHNSDDVVKIYNYAKDMGFNNINMDIILGLINENVDMVKHTLDKIYDLSPESLTVHTMAIKRASRLKENVHDYELSRYEDMIKMIDLSMKCAKNMNLNPYYMYRQKHMLGNLENIGYAKEGFECIYNIQIMEEKQTIFALGAGAVSKIVYLDENRIERVANVKNIEHYISRVDEMIQRKKKEVGKC